jgi:hypothetical protein
MSDDKLMAALAQLAREEQKNPDATHGTDPAADDPWVRIVEGKAGPDELGALETRAAEDPLVKAALEAYRPLDARTRDAMAARALEKLGAAPPKGEEGAPPQPADAAPVSNVVPFGRTMGRALMVLAPLAAAAAVAFVVMGKGGGDSLPDYAVDVTGGDRKVRGDDGVRSVIEPQRDPHAGAVREVHVSEGSRFSIVLRPETRVEGPVAARAVLVRDGRSQEFRVPIEVAPEGAVRLVATTEDFPAPAHGTWGLVVVVGRPDALPASEDVARKAAGRGFRTFDVRVVVEEPSPAE